MLARAELGPNSFEKYQSHALTTTPTTGVCYNPNRFIEPRGYAGYKYTNRFNILGIEND